jgi:hypothetical protein
LDADREGAKSLASKVSKSDKTGRLAAALRANLKRRKARDRTKDKAVARPKVPGPTDGKPSG